MCVRFEPAAASQKAASKINAKSGFQSPTMVCDGVIGVRLFCDGTILLLTGALIPISD